MESGQKLRVSQPKSPEQADRPESPLTGLEFDMSRLSLEAQYEGLREKVQELQTELLDEKSHEQHLRREQLVETKQIREEERKRAQAIVSDVRRKLYKEKQQEIHELREKLLKEKEKEIAYIVKQKDEEFRKAQLNWNREKDDLVQKLRVQFTKEIREEAKKSHEKQTRKLEVYIEELKDQKRMVEESCKLAQEADKKKVDQIRRMHLEHEQDLAKLKRSSWQEGRKQMAEIRQLTNIIHQLEKKLGVESGHYIRLQLEKDNLRDKLDRIKGNEMSGRKSPLSTSRTDLTGDLSMFSYPSVDDSNPMWLQIKQQKGTIAQLKQSVQDRNRRIELLKQKLFKNRRFGGVMHRSMDDILSYESSGERDDCISPVFGYSTGSSDASSLNEESFQSDSNQEAEIIRRLQKEILQLQRAHSLLQANAKSSMDAKRTQIDKEQLQTDLIEAQRQIDELNKDLVECNDRNELLEFQLQEALQHNFDEGNYIPSFKIPTLSVDYQFSDEELHCSGEEIKARLEQLQNEKKPFLTRDEQLTLLQAKRLLENIPAIQEHSSRTFSLNDDHTECNVPMKDYLQLPVFDDLLKNDSLMEETDCYVKTTTHLGDVFVERDTVGVELDRDVDQQQSVLEEVEVGSPKTCGKESVQLCDVVVQTTLYESPEELRQSQQKFLDLEEDLERNDHKESVQLFDAEVQTISRDILEERVVKSDVLQPYNDLAVEKIDTGIQCSIFCPVTNACSQCNILEVDSFSGETFIKFHDNGSDLCKFKRVLDSKDVGIQVVADDVSFTSKTGRRLSKEETSTERRKDAWSFHGVNKSVQCNIIEILTQEEEILFVNELKTLRFKKIPVLIESAVQTDMAKNDFIAKVVNDDVTGNDAIGNDVVGNNVMMDNNNDLISADVICNDVNVANVTIEDDGVREKHDGEPSEKTLRGMGWKDSVDGSELGDDAKVLDCIVYEKEDVFIVICETYRKYCKEISSNDYTFDFDEDDDEDLETCSEEQLIDRNDTAISDTTVYGDMDCKMASEGSYRAEDGKDVYEVTQHVPASSKTVMRNIQKVEIGIQCENQEDEYNTTIDEKCPHCLKSLSDSPKFEKDMTDNRNENCFVPTEVDDSMLHSQLNQDKYIAETDTGNKLDMIDEFQSEEIEFDFREMCDVAVQYDEQDNNNSNGLCRRCHQSKTLCNDIGIQCEFADLLSSSNGMLDEIKSGVFEEDEGESLIKEVMALAQECSQNDALIDQHLSEVVRGQDLFNQIQDVEDYDDDEGDGDEVEISLSDEQSRDLYNEIPHSCVLLENAENMLFDLRPNSEKIPNDMQEETQNIPYREVRDMETQCEKNEACEKEVKAVQCMLLDDRGKLGTERIPVGEDLPTDKQQDNALEGGNVDSTKRQRDSRAIRTLPEGSGFESSPESSNGEGIRVVSENTVSKPALDFDLNNVFDEMDAQPTNPVLAVTLMPQEINSLALSHEIENVAQQFDGISRSLAEEPAITRTSKADTLRALDETFQAFEVEGPGSDDCDDERDLQATMTKHFREASATKLSKKGPEVLPLENDRHSSEETSSSETSSQVTVEHNHQTLPVSPPSTPENPPPFEENHMRNHPTRDKHPPITTPPSDVSPNPDTPPRLPVTLPPTLPSASPPSVMLSDLDDDIEALLAGEFDLDAGNLTPMVDQNPQIVRPTLEHEVQAILESEDSSVRSEPNTVLSVDSLYMNETATVGITERGAALSLGNSSRHENTDVLNDGTEMTSSFDADDIISCDVTSVGDQGVLSEVNDDKDIFETDDRFLYASLEDFTLDAHPKSERKLRHDADESQRIMKRRVTETESSPVKNVVFESEASQDSTAETISASEGIHRRQPPPVLPKPKHRSHSMNLPISELPPVPKQGERFNSMAAQRDIVDGCFPPVGLVPKRASEFNLGECDLLKERIVYLERQLKNKENLLQTMKAEATEIETNAYIQKKEEDIKMMDESVRFLKVENQKKEKELISKIGELNKCTFELEQLKSERSNAEREREILEDNVNSLQDQVSQLQCVQVKYQELRCKCDNVVKENACLHEQVSRLHRADEEFVELEKTISKLQGKLKELEDVKRERDDVSEQLKTLKTQKDDLAHKGRKVETERNDFLMNSKLIQQQKENLEARNKALQRTNDTFKTKISSLEKECRDNQKKLFEVQRDRDEGSSQMRKLEAERNEMRKRVNELIECKSELKQYQSKSQDLERELNYLRTQSKKNENERTELSTELGNCLKERNRLVARAAELEKLSRDNEKLEEKFHTLKLKIAELTGQRDDAEVQLPTLKAKVALLKKACKEKDDQLDKLKTEIRELKHSVASSALEDLSSMPSFSFGSPEKSVKFRDAPDLNNNRATSDDSVKGKQFVVLFDYDPQRLSTTGHPEKELKLNEGDVITVNSSLDLNGYYMAELNGKKGMVSSLYIEEVDEYDMRKLRQQRESKASKSPMKKPSPHNIPPRTLSSMPGLIKRSFVALNDYNPFTSSTATRPDLELPLAAGESVTVVGDVDANGYYTVEKGGRLALVPSNLVKPSSPSLARPNKLNFASPVQSTEPGRPIRDQDETPGLSTSKPSSGHYPSHSSNVSRHPTVIRAAPPGSTPYASKEFTEQFIRQSSVENSLTTPAQNASCAIGNRGNSESKAMNMSSALPSVPRNLRVLRCVNKDALLLGWIAPEVDELGRNNGQVIKGYKIFANGQPSLVVDSPYMAKALVENLDLTRPVELAIQTVAENGFCSEKSVTHFNEAVMMETTSVTTEDISHLDHGLPYRTFVALFSYDPLKSSPNPNPTLELEFQEGDIVRVLDTSRPDGYYTGQVNGDEGLVPSNFLEEIAVAARPQQRKRDTHSHASTSTPSPKKSQAMVALYDYNPTAQSPNKHPDRELSFRKGQVIRVLGAMRSDGFYEADISGQRGLVPATFLKPCKRKSTTKSVNAANGVASLPRRVQFAHEQDSRQLTAGYV